VEETAAALTFRLADDEYESINRFLKENPA
jgi:hypothetical protein